MNQDYEAKFKVGDKIRLYGKETTIRGFYISYNDALNKYETIMLTDGRGDPFERSLDAIEWLNESIELPKDWQIDLYNRINEIPMSMGYANAVIREVENVIAPLLQNENKGEHKSDCSGIGEWGIDENKCDCKNKGDDLVSSVDIDTLKEDLMDKRVEAIMEEGMAKYKLGDHEVSDGKNAYYLSRKEIAQDLLDKYHIIKK